MPLLLAFAAVLTLSVSQVQKESIEGIRNYSKVDATIGCGGATDPRALAEISKRGYKAVLNLREATEEGALVDESRTAAEAAGLKYIHLPFRASAPDATVVEAFLKTVAATENQPLFIHCGSANRVAALWLIKRVAQDKWAQDKALEEAKAIGLTSAALEKFALDYLAKRQ